MNRRGLVLACTALLSIMVISAAANASPRQWPDPRHLLRAQSADELSGLLVQLEGALAEAAVVEDRDYAATVYQVAEVAKDLFSTTFSSVLPPDGLDRLRAIREGALRVGAPLIAEEMFAKAYEELGFVVSTLTEVVTGRQRFGNLPRSQLVTIIRRNLSEAEGLIARIEGLMAYIPGGDAFAPQNYAYFVRKISTIRLMADDLNELLAAVE